MPDHLVYFADPMCSWCWGFSPVIEAVRERQGAELPVHLIMGGLYPGTEEPLTETGKETIREHWQHVNEASGQPFEFSFFDREGFVYDTEPPSRAVVAMRRIDPEKAFALLKRIHGAFYTENRDVTDPDVLADLAAETGVARETFLELFNADDVRQETQTDFSIARRAGITGFPTLIAGRGEGEPYVALSIGYQPLHRIESLIAQWQNQAAAAE